MGCLKWLGFVGAVAVFAVGCSGDTGADASRDGGSDASSSQQGPVLPGFTWGGIAGNVCPPGSTEIGDCPGPDCGGSCVATDKCDSESSACGAGFACEQASGYCLPEKTCDTSAECATGDYCAQQALGLSKGICVAATSTGAACESGEECAFPTRCVGGSCVLMCTLGAPDDCPSGWACVENTCAPPL